MATYIYNSTEMSTVIDTYKIISNLTSSTHDATQSALKVISSIASAGGDLGAEVGGTVLGNIKKASNGIASTLGEVKKVYNTFETAKQVLEKIKSWNGFSDLAGTIDKLAGMSREEQGELIVDTADFIGDTIKTFSEDPVSKTVLGNAGKITEAGVSAVNFLDSLGRQYPNPFESGVEDKGAAFSGMLGGTVTAGTLVAADVVGNAFGVDIPDHWISSSTHAVADLSESFYRFASSGLKSLWNAATDLFH